MVNLGFQYDLRLFEYSSHEALEDIYKSDPEKKKVIDEKFKKVIEDEWKYHQYLTDKEGEEEYRTFDEFSNFMIEWSTSLTTF